MSLLLHLISVYKINSQVTLDPCGLRGSASDPCPMCLRRRRRSVADPPAAENELNRYKEVHKDREGFENKLFYYINGRFFGPERFCGTSQRSEEAGSGRLLLLEQVFIFK